MEKLCLWISVGMAMLQSHYTSWSSIYLFIFFSKWCKPELFPLPDVKNGITLIIGIYTIRLNHLIHFHALCLMTKYLKQCTIVYNSNVRKYGIVVLHRLSRPCALPCNYIVVGKHFKCCLITVQAKTCKTRRGGN